MAVIDYSLSADFGGSLDSYVLHKELEALSLSVVFQGLLLDGDVVSATFDSAPTGPDTVLVNAAVSAYPTGTIPTIPESIAPTVALVDKTGDPTATDDNSYGYGVGTRWVNNLKNTAWVCISAASGAAVWNRTTNYVNADNDRIELYDSTGGQVFTGAGVFIDFNVTRINTDPARFSTTGSTITCNFTGTVSIMYDVSINGGNNRCTSRTVLYRAGSEVPGTRSWGYHRNDSSGEDTMSCGPIHASVTSGTAFRVATLRQSGNVSLVTLANGSRFTIERTS